MHKDNFSIFKGANFYFKEEGHIINSWFSSFSGLEKVLVNGALVSKQRNLSMKSHQPFEIDGISYKTEFSTTNLFKGPFVCTLYKNDVPHKIKKLVFFDEKKKVPFFMKFWFYLILGVVFGFSKSFLNLPNWTFYIFIGVVFIFVYTYSKLNKTEPQITEESV